jgi:hypothetical protein
LPEQAGYRCLAPPANSQEISSSSTTTVLGKALKRTVVSNFT